MTNTVLILGASGSFGSNCATAFSAAGWNVRKFKRYTESMAQAAKGVDIIVNGLNPPNYKNWDTELPKIAHNVVEAAKASGATILQPGNVYNFGKNGGTWDEGSPHNAHTKKGKIRIGMEGIMRKATVNHGIQVIILRGGDFIDSKPSGNFFDHLAGKLDKGVFAYPGNPDIPHAWAYLPDMARAAVMLSEKRAELGRFEDVPFEGHTLSARQIIQTLAQITGHQVKLATFPWLMMKLLSPFWVLAREMQEMRYLWDTPHSLDGSKLTKLCPDFKMTETTVMLKGAMV